jgi:hypothetical protein
MLVWTQIAAILLGASAIAVVIFHRFENRKRQVEWESRWLKRTQAAQSEIGRLRGEVAELKSRIEDQQADGDQHIHRGINLNHRTQALRLLRRGESAESVAATLGITKCEVELIHKVQKITSEMLLSQSFATDPDGSVEGKRRAAVKLEK